MIKIRIGKVEEVFQDNRSAMEYVADKAGKRKLKFQRLAFDRRGNLEEMDYLTYHQGRIRETYNTRA